MEQPAAQPTKLTPEQVRAQYPDVIAAERKEAADQERARILGIEALDGPKELLQKCKADASCTVEQAALRVNEAQKASRAAHMDALRQDERQLDPPAPLAEEGEESSASAEATRVLQLHQRLRGRAPAGANC